MCTARSTWPSATLSAKCPSGLVPRRGAGGAVNGPCGTPAGGRWERGGEAWERRGAVLGRPGALGRLPAPGTAGGYGELRGRGGGGALGGRSVGRSGESLSLPSHRRWRQGHRVALPGAPPPGFPSSRTLLCLCLTQGEGAPPACCTALLRGEPRSEDPAQAAASLVVLLGGVTLASSLQVV